MRNNQVIRNEETGESLTMLASEHDSGGKRQIYRVELPANRPSPPLHYHVAFIEKFSVVEGTLDVYLGKRREHRRLRKGESVTVEKLQLHTFANSSDSPCKMQVETIPAGGVVRAFQLAYGVANEGNASDDGLPANPIVRLRFVQISQGFLPRIPMAIQRAVFAIAAVISKVTVLEAHIQKHLIEEE